ncbi:hypothetical protein LzC2_27690 [Planctomycetes bacterium LzC2]|uniref:Uncharacterized protein n=1 Tax=Alienimonas chondri TaxID=2681879 RepID=A0ABX1VF04_9PLAN|nr:hypothetical protein [Alienimonas chondri]
MTETPPPPEPRLEQQINGPLTRSIEGRKAGVGCLDASALTFFLTGLQYIAMSGPYIGMGVSCWLIAATFAAAAVTAWRGWVWTTLWLVALAFVGPPLVVKAWRQIASLL